MVQGCNWQFLLGGVLWVPFERLFLNYIIRSSASCVIQNATSWSTHEIINIAENIARNTPLDSLNPDEFIWIIRGSWEWFLWGLSKSYHCIPHDLLITPLTTYGFGNSILHLIYSYLSGRKQTVTLVLHLVTGWISHQEFHRDPSYPYLSLTLHKPYWIVFPIINIIIIAIISIMYFCNFAYL